VRIVKGAFGDNLPQRDLLLSAWHSVYVNGIFIPAYDLLNDRTVYQDTSKPKITYYHLELASHSAVYAEGMPAETYLDDNNRGFFLSNTEDGKHTTDLAAQVPKLASQQIWASKGFAKVVRKGPELDAVRQQLAERIAVLATQQERVAA
jgi:Hint domain